MKAKLLPTLVGAVLAGGMTAAAADVTVFGHIDLGLSSIDDETNVVGPGPTDTFDDTNFQCTTCSIGFKGSEDLGNGLKAIFKLDFQYDITKRNRASSGSNSLFDRDQWLGLAGNFGQVRIGTISTLYKSHGAKLDPLYRTALQGRSHGLQSSFHTGAGEELQGRATDTVRWDSPSWNGLKVGAHYTLDTGETPEDDDPFGLGASYSNGGIFVFVDYLDNNSSADPLNGVSEVTAWKVGGKYTYNDFAVMAQYEDSNTDSGPGMDLDAELWHVGGTYTMGNNTLYAAYGQADNDIAGGGSSEPDSWTIAGIHKMSKRTSVYAGYNSQDTDPQAVGADGDIEEFSLGVKHKF